MATTASDIQAQAAIDAWLNSQAVKDMQNNINSAYEAGVTQAGLSNEQIMNQLDKYATDYKNQYQKDAKSAYLNKMQGEQLVSNELARLGLTNSGWGVSQKLQNHSIYSQNLSGLKDALGQKLTKVDSDKLNQQLEYEKTLQQLLATKNEQQYNYNQYVADMAEQIRQQEISNYLQEQYNNYLYANLAAQKSSNNGVDVSGNDKTETPIQDAPKEETKSGTVVINGTEWLVDKYDLIQSIIKPVGDSGPISDATYNALVNGNYIDEISYNGKTYYKKGPAVLTEKQYKKLKK